MRIILPILKICSILLLMSLPVSFLQAGNIPPAKRPLPQSRFLPLTAPSFGTTTFTGLFASTMILAGTGSTPSPLSFANAGNTGWDFAVSGSSSNVTIAVAAAGHDDGSVNDWCIRTNVNASITDEQTTISSDDGSPFRLTSVWLKINVPGGGSADITLTGSRSGPPVTGATLTVPTVVSGTWTQFNVSGISAFSNVDKFSFKQAATTTSNITFMVVDDITIATPVLPLTLVDFSGLRDENKVQLQWTTASEENTANFEVQRGSNGSDFTAIGRVQAAGNSQQTQHYNYTDILPAAGASAYLYRLKLADLDGQYTYSPVLRIGTPSSGSSISAYPNPYQQQLVLIVNATEAEKAQLIVMDMGGKVLQQTGLSLQKGANSFSLSSMTQLNKGIYLLNITTSKQRQTLRVVKTE